MALLSLIQVNSTTYKLYAEQALKDSAGNVIKDTYLPLTGGTVTGSTTFSTPISGDLLGNATTSDRLKNARTITIGSLSNSFDGSGNISFSAASMGLAPTKHASSSSTYGLGTTSLYGHVKTLTGDMNGTTSTDGIAAGLGHTHSLYLPILNYFIPSLGGGTYVSSSSSSITGALLIRLPLAVYQSRTMMRFTVSIYNYSTGTSCDYYVGGYNYENAAWVNEFAYSTGAYSSRGNLSVRFVSDDTYNYITIGEETTTWAYPQVVVHDLLLGYGGYTYSNWSSGWNISFVSTLPTTIKKTVTNPNVLYQASKWTTARTLTIGNTGKSVNGSGNVSWSLAEIGVAGYYLPLSAGSSVPLTGDLYTKTIYPNIADTYNLGSAGHEWANVYANTFYGNLSGNASTASKLKILATKSYTGLYCSNTSYRYRTLIHIVPNSYYDIWHIKYRITASSTGSSSYKCQHTVEFWGYLSSVAYYKIDNSILTYLLYYHTAFIASNSTRVSTYGHFFGYYENGNNYDSSTYARDLTVEILECDNCSYYELLDRPYYYNGTSDTESANDSKVGYKMSATGTKTYVTLSNYVSRSNYNATDNGLWETSDSDSTGYYIASNGFRFKVGDLNINGSALLLKTGNDSLCDIYSGLHNNIVSATTATTKTKNPIGFIPNEKIYWYSSSSYTTANSIVRSTIYEQYHSIDGRYNFNISTSEWAANTAIYLVFTYSAGLLYLCDTWWATALPTSEDGKIYQLVGYSYSSSTSYTHSLLLNNPYYKYFNGKIRSWNPLYESLDFPITFDNSDGIKIASDNADKSIWTVWDKASGEGNYGFRLYYKGTGSGDGNALKLVADNQSGTEVEAMSMTQAGVTTWAKALTVSSGNITASSGNITASNGYLVSTSNGKTVTIGSSNSSYCHFTTNAPAFYFNVGMYINGDTNPYVNNSYYLGISSKRWKGIYGVGLDISGTTNLAGTTTIDSATIGNLIVNGAGSFTGTVTAPTLTKGDNTTKVATTEFVTTAVADAVSSAVLYLGLVASVTDVTSKSTAGYGDFCRASTSFTINSTTAHVGDVIMLNSTDTGAYATESNWVVLHTELDTPLYSTGLAITTLNGSNNIYVPHATISLTGTVTTVALNFAGNKTFTGNVSVKTLTISDTNSSEHIKFSRTSYNYITAPSGGSIVFEPNGVGVAAANGMTMDSDGFRPSTNKGYSLGTSSYYWNNIYGTNIYLNGSALSSAATHAHSDYVTDLGTSGNTLTWKKGGTAQTAITIPYATKATNDSDGNAINTTYLKRSGGTMTGTITIPTGTSAMSDSNGNGILAYKPTSWTGIPASTGVALGTIWDALYIRTSGDNLYHYVNSASTVYTILDSNNSSVSGGGSSWGSYITVKINGTEKTLTIPSNPDTDTKVTLTVDTTTTNYRPVLLGYNDSASAIFSNVTNTAYAAGKIYTQPSTGDLITLGKFQASGNITSLSDIYAEGGDLYIGATSTTRCHLKYESNSIKFLFD